MFGGLNNDWPNFSVAFTAHEKSLPSLPAVPSVLIVPKINSIGLFTRLSLFFLSQKLLRLKVAFNRALISNPLSLKAVTI